MSVLITSDLDAFCKAMDDQQEQWSKEILELQKELNVSYNCASDVWYFRTRSRHTKEKETELIKLHAEGNPPNIMEWP